MAERKMFMGIGASVARLLAVPPGASSESTTKCLIAPNIDPVHPVNYDDDNTLVPVDLACEAGRCKWADIEHDAWGLRRDGDEMSPSSNPWDGISVTSIGFMGWPMYTYGAAAWVGAIYLLNTHFQKYRSRIEAPGRVWGSYLYTPAELASARYEDDKRYAGFMARVERGATGSPFKKLSIFRAGTYLAGSKEVAGTWLFDLSDPDQVDASISHDALNAGLPSGVSLYSLGTPISSASKEGDEGYVFLALKLAAQLRDPSQLGNGYGLTGPKLPFWLES
jgi:hypothetical protein